MRGRTFEGEPRSLIKYLRVWGFQTKAVYGGAIYHILCLTVCIQSVFLCRVFCDTPNYTPKSQPPDNKEVGDQLLLVGYFS